MTHLSAKENPFRVDRLHAIPFQFASGDWPQHLARLEAMEFRASVIGRRGSGKSALLRELTRRLRENGQAACYFNLPRRRDEVAPAMLRLRQASDFGAILMVDGIERIGFRNRLRLLAFAKSGPGLVVSNHFIGSQPVWIRTRATSATLRYVLSELEVDSPAAIRFAEQRFRHYRGNIRNVLRTMYDEMATGSGSRQDFRFQAEKRNS